MFLNAKGRNYVARRTCRGAYRDGKDVVRSDLVKPKKTLKCAVSTMLIAAAVVKDKIRMWQVIEGRWTGKKAAQMYEGPLLKCLEKAYPTHAKMVRGKKRHRKSSVLEDNDPTGTRALQARMPRKRSVSKSLSCHRKVLTLMSSITACGRKSQGVFASRSASSMQ